MTDQNIVFKNSKTGKVEQISANDIELVNFQKFIGSWGLRVFLKNGTLHRYGGFKDGVIAFNISLLAVKNAFNCLTNTKLPSKSILYVKLKILNNNI